MSIETKEWHLHINNLNIGFFESPLIKWSVDEANKSINFDLENSAFIDKQKFDELVDAESTIAELQGRLSAADSELMAWSIKAIDLAADLKKVSLERDQLRAQVEAAKVIGFDDVYSLAEAYKRWLLSSSGAIDAAQLAEQPKPAESVQEDSAGNIGNELHNIATALNHSYEGGNEAIADELENLAIRLWNLNKSPKVEQVSGGDETEMFLIATGDYHKGHATYTGHFQRPENFDENNLLHNRIWFEPKSSPNKADVPEGDFDDFKENHHSAYECEPLPPLKESKDEKLDH